jgi:hypothetical protein
MTTCKLVLPIAIVAVAGCGRPANHVEAPTLPEPETIEDAETAEPAPVESDETNAEKAEPEAAKPPQPESKQEEGESAAPAAPPKKKCADLPQKTCEITAGCVWSTKDKCIGE